KSAGCHLVLPGVIAVTDVVGFHYLNYLNLEKL
ncbi:MAG: hypothetical protein ACI9QL_001599, partial [Candidatus Omnitrophota bacterium]